MTKKRRRSEYVAITDKAFDPYAKALGQLALAWNGLHQTLALLFCTVMGGGVANQFLAIWHSIKVDRTQRDILLAATRSNYMPAVPENFEADVLWLCKQAESVEDARNDALHSPLLASRRGRNNTIIAPATGLGHTRATKLMEKDLLADFQWCRDHAIILSQFAFAMDQTLCDFRRPWPERPAWTSRKATTRRPPSRA